MTEIRHPSFPNSRVNTLNTEYALFLKTIGQQKAPVALSGEMSQF